MLGGHGGIKSGRRVELIPRQDGRQPVFGDAVFQAFARLAIADDDHRHDAGRRLLRGHLKRSLAWAGLGRNHHAVSHARAGRLHAVEIGDAETPWVGLEPLFGVQTNANPNRDEGTKGAVHPCTEFDPLLRGFGPGGREAEQKHG